MYKVETYEIEGWEDAETGLLISENKDWILVKHIPVDYVIDGYRLYKKEFITKRQPAKKAEQIEKVLELKGIKVEQPNNFEFADTLNLLKWCEAEFGLFEFQDEDDTELFYGKINSVDGNELVIDMIHSDATIEPEYEYDFALDEIRVITFLTDYFISIQLLMNYRQEKKITL